MRSYMRDINLGRDPREEIAARVGMTGEQVYDLYRLLVLALHDRVRQIGTVADFPGWFDIVRGNRQPAART